MITISLCMIVRDEETVLARCLDCVAGLVDEIIIVDTGSTDRTPEIAQRYTEQVYSFLWVDDFSAARNFSFSKAGCDYILWLDADDILPSQDAAALLTLKEGFPPDIDVGMLRYEIAFDPEGSPTFSYYRERLLRRERNYRWQEPVHEFVAIPDSRTQSFDIAIRHAPLDQALSSRNLEIYQRRLQQGVPFSPRATYYYARELYHHHYYEDAAAQYRLFLSLQDIWEEDAIWAHLDLSDCLRELQRDSEALETLFSSFRWDLPRAETACRIGGIYFSRGENDKAIFWYKLALRLPKPDHWGFVAEDFWGFIPHMQLCVLYYGAGQLQKALAHHRAAQRLKPKDETVLYNERFFDPESQDAARK